MWNLELFLNVAPPLHNNKYDYSFIKTEDITGCKSIIRIKCNKCGKVFLQRVLNHIDLRQGCYDCAHENDLNLGNFITKAIGMYFDRYDYSLITEEHIKNAHSRVQIICTKCKSTFYQVIKKHIYDGQGCAICKCSHGETSVQNYLNRNNIKFDTQFELKDLPKKKYDFVLHDYNNRKYIIEYDGMQHFMFVKRFHKIPENFEKEKKIDIIKSQTAIDNGYILIRLSCNINKIQEHLDIALNPNYNLPYYLSSDTMYESHEHNLVI